MRRSRAIATTIAAIATLMTAAWGGVAFGPAASDEPHTHPPHQIPATSVHYMHVLGSIADRFPMNTQRPDFACERDENAGATTPTIVTSTGTAADIRFQSNWFYAFNTAGYVECQNGEPRIHQEPGLAADVRLAGDPTLTVYVSAYAAPGQSSSSGILGQSVPGAVPQLGLYARWETGRHPFQGALIAEGDSNGAAPIGNRNVISLPGGAQVHELKINLRRIVSTIPGEGTGTILSFNLYQVKAKSGPLEGAEATQADWRLRSGPDYAPRLTVREYDAVRTVSAGLRVESGNLVADWGLLSPWGSYDVDDRSLRAVLTGPDYDRIPHLVSIRKSVDHGGHFKPVEATWSIATKDLPNGHYWLTLYASNLQGTGTHRQAFEFDVQGQVRLP